MLINKEQFSENIDLRYLDDIKQGKHLTAFGMSPSIIKEAKKISKQNPIQSPKICVDCDKYYRHETKDYIINLCKACEDKYIGLKEC